MIEIPNFTIEREVGRGGMALVYLAVQDMLSRHVALKVLLPDMMKDENFRKSFLSEGKIIASLEHPNIVRIHDIGIVDDSIFYMAMEYLSGGTLKEKLGEGKFPYDVALKILEETAKGLSYAHCKGYIHRDIKPGNILFRDDGTAVLTDFGIAKLQDTSGDLTRLGFTLGTVQYMSPEQAITTDLDSRSDIYSLGLVFYEMLTGQKAFKAESNIQAIHQHTTVPPPKLPDEYAFLQATMDKVLAKEPEQRFQTTDEFVQAVKRAALHPAPIVTEPSEDTIHTDKTIIHRVAPAAATPAPTAPAPETAVSAIHPPKQIQKKKSQKKSSALIPAVFGGLALIGVAAFGVIKYPDLIGKPEKKPDVTESGEIKSALRLRQEELARKELEEKERKRQEDIVKEQSAKQAQEKEKQRLADLEKRKVEEEERKKQQALAEQRSVAEKEQQRKRQEALALQQQKVKQQAETQERQKQAELEKQKLADEMKRQEQEALADKQAEEEKRKQQETALAEKKAAEEEQKKQEELVAKQKEEERKKEAEITRLQAQQKEDEKKEREVEAQKQKDLEQQKDKETLAKKKAEEKEKQRKDALAKKQTKEKERMRKAALAKKNAAKAAKKKKDLARRKAAEKKRKIAAAKALAKKKADARRIALQKKQGQKGHIKIAVTLNNRPLKTKIVVTRSGKHIKTITNSYANLSLPPGNYVVTAFYGGKSSRAAVNIGAYETAIQRFAFRGSTAPVRQAPPVNSKWTHTHGPAKQ